MDRGAWPTAVHGIAKSQTQLKRFSTYMHCTWLNVGTEAQGDFPTLCPDLEAEEESERLGQREGGAGATWPRGDGTPPQDLQSAAYIQKRFGVPDVLQVHRSGWVWGLTGSATLR